MSEHRTTFQQYLAARTRSERLAIVRSAPSLDRFFILAAHEADVRAMREALQFGADLNAIDPILGDTALHFAVSSPHIRRRRAAIEFLLARGIDLAGSPTGFTALHEAANCGVSDDAIRLLVKGGIDVDARDELGCTPLHCAPLYLGQGAAPELLRLGADVNARSLEDRTPLHGATWVVVEPNLTPIAELCQVLLASGANPYAEDLSGKRPIENVVAWPTLMKVFEPYLARWLPPINASVRHFPIYG